MDYNRKTEPYDMWRGYAQSKAANVLFTHALAARGIRSISLTPGGKSRQKSSLIYSLSVQLSGGHSLVPTSHRTSGLGCRRGLPRFRIANRRRTRRHSRRVLRQFWLRHSTRNCQMPAICTSASFTSQTQGLSIQTWPKNSGC